MSKMEKDIYLSGKELTDMVQLRREDVGDYAIVPGPKERLVGILKDVENPIKNFSFMEYEMHTGTVNDTRVTVMNGGRYSADTAITAELLCAVGIPVMIRLGTCGALRDDIKIGDIIVVDSALAEDGVTPFYTDSKEVIQANKEVADVIEESAKATGITVHRGKSWSHDALLRQTKDKVNAAIDQGCITSDMVSSTFLTLTQQANIPAVTLLAVGDNVVTGDFGYLDANFYMTEHMLTGVCFDFIKKWEAKKAAA